MIFGQVALMMMLLVMTFWRRDILLYILCCPLFIVTGLRWYDLYHNPAGFTMALVLIAIGLYCVGLAIINLVKR